MVDYIDELETTLHNERVRARLALEMMQGIPWEAEREPLPANHCPGCARRV